jgi:hypothetical protein
MNRNSICHRVQANIHILLQAKQCLLAEQSGIFPAKILFCPIERGQKKLVKFPQFALNCFSLFFPVKKNNNKSACLYSKQNILMAVKLKYETQN